MNQGQLLNLKQTVQTDPGHVPCTVDQYLGSGGQGEVYRATLGCKQFALKWYYEASATEGQRAAIGTLVKMGPPTEKFLWPLALADDAGVEGFGYVMPLRKPGYKGIVDMMKRLAEPSFRALTTAGFDLAHSYHDLHTKGLCYRDISFGNVFFDPKTGEVLICDNDNVAVDTKGQAGVLGTPRFMAPEIVRAETNPSTQTDLYSLSVLLFYMFMLHHPLEGQKEQQIKCFDAPAMNKLYGTEPVFIFDPNNDTNRPVPGYHDNAIAYWPVYPLFFRDLFIKAFTNGIRDPQNGRVREPEWRSAMVRLRDSIVYCTSCSAENFYDGDALRQTPGATLSCWSCKNALRLPYRIRIGKNVVMLNHDTKLHPHHVDDQKPYDFSKPVAEVARHPSDPNIWGLRNLAPGKWVCTLPDGTVKDVEPGRNAPLAVGVKIHFGKVESEIRV